MTSRSTFEPCHTRDVATGLQRANCRAGGDLRGIITRAARIAPKCSVRQRPMRRAPQGRPRSAVLARRPRRRRVRPRMGSIRSAGCRDGRGDMLLEPDRCSPRSSCTSGSRSRYAPIEGWLIPPIPIRDNGWSRKWGYLFLCVDGVADRFGSIASRRFGPSSNRRPKDTNFRLMHCTK